MKQVNMREAKTELFHLVKLLETHQEESILIARNGTPIVEMKLAKQSPAKKRFGVAEGKFTLPTEFDAWDAEIMELFEGEK